MNERDLNDIVGLIYEAAAEDEAWALVTHRLGRFFDDAAVSIDYQSTTGDVAHIAAFSNLDPIFKNIHFEEYATPLNNPGLAAILREPVRKPFQMASFLDEQAYQRDPSCRAILAPQRINKVMLVTLERNQSAFCYSNIYRRQNQLDFTAQESEAFALIAGHLARGLTLRRQIGFRKLGVAEAEKKIEAGHTIDGLLVINSRCEVLDADANAYAILHKANGVDIRNGRLVCRANGAFGAAADLRTFFGHSESGNSCFVVRGSSGEVISIRRLDFPDLLFGHAKVGGQLFAVQLVQLGRVPRIPAVFAGAFGLTPAEQRVLGSLIDCSTATEAARHLGVSRYTMKSHLASIYAKTGCPSLPQLLLLIGRFI